LNDIITRLQISSLDDARLDIDQWTTVVRADIAQEAKHCDSTKQAAASLISSGQHPREPE
jgi:hypothetical protein